MVQRRMAGGLTATRLASSSTIVSSRTRSEAPHSPGPSIGGTDGATASSAVNRSRQADGADSCVAVGEMAVVTVACGGDDGKAVPGFDGGVGTPANAANGRRPRSGTLLAA